MKSFKRKREFNRKHMKTICKIGQGNLCCRYLTSTINGVACSKHDDNFKEIIDQKVFRGDFVAIGDNCEGFPKDVYLTR